MRKTLLLFTVLLFGLQGWATTFTVDGVTYTITDATNKTVAIGTGTSTAAISKSTAGAFTIPSSVSYNGENYAVTAIGDGAFWLSENLTSVTIPSSVTSIGSYSFEECTALTSLYIPSSITSIGDGAFDLCYKLTSINVDASNSRYSSITGVLFDKAVTTLIKYPNGITSTSYSIPSSVVTIGYEAFDNCSSLTSITIPSSVRTISDYAFNGCTSIASITLPSSITSIGDATFRFCTSLTSITIPSSVASITSSAFMNCTKLASINVDASNPKYSSINGVLFDKAATTLILYPPGGDTSYTIPNSVTSIGENSFCNCTALTSVVIPSSVTSIKHSAFEGCTSLISVKIPSSVTTIEDGAFWECKALTSIIIPSSVTSIQSYTFYECTSLKSIDISSSISSIPSSTFGFCSSLASVTIPSSVTSIGEWAFQSCTSLKSIVIPTSVTSLRGFVFQSCTALTSVNIPSSITSIGDQEFAYCSSLKNITIPSSVDSIGKYAFFSCSSLTEIYANGKTPANITIGTSVFVKASTTTCTLYVPTGSKTLYAAANQWKDFVNIVEVPSYTISASANVSANGNVTGTDNYISGSNCTLQAIPKSGYVFSNWTENGTVVSTNPSYVFTVSTARTLVANFSAVTVAVTQPTAAKLSGSIVVTPSTGFTYSLDGKTYQSSNEFPYVSIGIYNITLKSISDGTVSPSVLAVVNASGVVAANNYQIKASNCTCRDTKDGAIAVTLAKALDYTVTVTATSTGSEQSIMFSGTSYNLKNLPADTYKLVFNIDFLDNYEQSFNVVVTQPDDLSVLKVSAEKSRATYALSGGTNYYVSVNDNTTETQGDQVQVSLVPGENKIKIYTEKLCQGVYEETIYNSENGQISIFPNPTTGKITLGIPGEEESVTAEIVSLSGAVQLEQKLVVPASRLVDIDVSDFIRGTYIVKLNGSTVHSSVKMIKK